MKHILQACVFKKYILWMKTIHYPELNQIPHGHNRTNGAVYPKSTSYLRYALHFGYSIIISSFIPALILLILITIKTTIFITLLTTLFIVTIYCAHCTVT